MKTLFFLLSLIALSLAQTQTTPPRCIYVDGQTSVAIEIGGFYTTTNQCIRCQCVAGAAAPNLNCNPTGSCGTTSSPTSVATGTSASTATPTEQTTPPPRCIYQNAFYNVGESWSPSSSGGCILCTCTAGTATPIVNCRKNPSPPNGVNCPTESPGTTSPPNVPRCERNGLLFDVGSYYITDNGCEICRCLYGASNTIPDFSCTKLTGPNVPESCFTTVAPEPRCPVPGTNGATSSVPVGTVITKDCYSCTCTRDAFSNSASFVCVPLPASAILPGTNCPTATPPPIYCELGTIRYFVGDTFTDSRGCQICTCNANRSITCVPINTCNTAPPVDLTCRVGNKTIKIGETIFFPPCRICRCSYVQASTANSAAASAQLFCYYNDTRCFTPKVCYVGNVSYDQGATFYPERCKACVCDEGEWKCRLIPASGCPTSPPDNKCYVTGGGSYDEGQVVRFEPCRECVCRCDPTTATNVAACAFKCTQVPNCNPPTTSAPTNGGTRPPTEPPIRFCFDKAGNAFPVGSVVSSADGCGICICTIRSILADTSNVPTATSQTITTETQWQCRPVNQTTGAPCCERNGVAFRLGQSILDRENCNNCTCTNTGWQCNTLSNATCKFCFFGGRRYANGESRRDEDGCGKCTCNNGQWECDDEKDCKRTCISFSIRIVFKNTQDKTSFLTISQIIARCDAILGVGNYKIERFDTNPDNITVVIIVRCWDSKFSTALEEAEDLEEQFTFSFTSSGCPPDETNASITDEGVEATSDSAPTLFTILFLLLALMSLLF